MFKLPFLSIAQNWQQREKICRVCPHINNNKCSLCGCYVVLKCKLENAKCPVGKWNNGSIK